jgi:hypothetical protein
VAARRASAGPLVTALLAAFAAYVVVQAVGVVVSAVEGDEVDAAGLVLGAVLAQGCGLTGATLAGRWRP